MRWSRSFAMVSVVLVLGGGLFVWRWEQRGPGRASVGDAVGRFRASSTSRPLSRSREPRPGVYLYAGIGGESLSFLSTRQAQGPDEPGTVTLEPSGCWQFRIDFNSFHDQTWNRCSARGRLVETGGTTGQRFDFLTFKTSEHSDVTCKPPIVLADVAAAPGRHWPVQCTGHSETTKTTFAQTGVSVFVGREVIEVGRKSVPALHTREDLRLSGGQTGEVRVDVWFATASGLPLKEAHLIRVASPAPAPLNHVTYTEIGNWQLTSTTPRT